MLPHVHDLIQELNGKTVITSDHGNLIGERTFPIPIRTYGHPRNLYKRELIEVPWAIIEAEERRKVKSEPQTELAEVDKKKIRDRSEHLGYM